MTTTWITQVFQSLSRPLTWWVVVATWEQAVRVRFGKRVHELGPGIHLRIPFVDRIYVQSTRLRTTCSTGLTITTEGGQTVTLSLAIEYSIASTLRVYETLANPDTILRCRFERMLTAAVAAVPSGLTVHFINKALEIEVESMDLGVFGLRDARAFVTSFAVVRPIRLMSNDYVTSTSLHNIEEDSSVGERK